jgi:hypothetical protein
MKGKHTNETLYIALYHHRHGVDCLPFLVAAGIEFGEEDVIESLVGTWEGPGTEANRNDEWVEIQKIDDRQIVRVTG